MDPTLLKKQRPTGAAAHHDRQLLPAPGILGICGELSEWGTDTSHPDVAYTFDEKEKKEGGGQWPKDLDQAPCVCSNWGNNFVREGKESTAMA